MKATEAVKSLEGGREGLSGVEDAERSESSDGNWGGPPRPKLAAESRGAATSYSAHGSTPTRPAGQSPPTPTSPSPHYPQPAPGASYAMSMNTTIVRPQPHFRPKLNDVSSDAHDANDEEPGLRMDKARA